MSEREPEGIIRIGEEEFKIQHPEPPTPLDVEGVRQAHAKGESLAPEPEVPSGITPGPGEEIVEELEEIPSAAVQLERSLPPGLGWIVKHLPEKKPPKRLKRVISGTTWKREWWRGAIRIGRRIIIGVPLAAWLILKGTHKFSRFWGVHRREVEHTEAWARLLNDSSEASGMTERMIRLSKHITKNMDPNAQKTWEYGFRENAVSIVRAVNQIRENTGLTWNQLEQRWIEWGMEKEATNVIKQIWREATTHDGLVKEAFEELLKKTSQLMEMSKGLVEALNLDRVIDPDSLAEITQIFIENVPRINPQALEVAVRHIFSPKDTSQASIQGVPTSFAILAVGCLIASNVPKARVREWTRRQMEKVVKKAPGLEKFLKPSQKSPGEEL